MKNSAPSATAPPYLTVEVIDEAWGKLGYVVIDRPVRSATSGGIRFAVDVSPEELASLARSMTYKWAFLNVPMGGAKAGICVDPHLTGFGGGQSAIDWDDPLLLQAQDDIAFSARLFYLLSQETTWPSLNDVEERFLFSPGIASQMHGLAFDSFCSEVAKYSYLPYDQRAAYFALCNPDRRLFQYYTVFHRSHFEQRFPFYDYRYFEFVYALPPEMLYKRRLRRAIILKMMPYLANIPYDKDNLPITQSKASLIKAKLVGKGKSFINKNLKPIFPTYATLYADYENWLRHELREWGESILFDERIFQRDIFNAEFLYSLWRRHQSGLEEHTIGKIAPIMTYEMMLRRFYD